MSLLSLRAWVWLGVLAGLTEASALALSVGVDSSGGVPKLVVDGQPVRARLFWGAPKSAPIKITPQWQHESFEFTASGDAANGTMHFRFGQRPGDIYLDDIHVVDLDSGKDLIPLCDFEAGAQSFERDWTYWPTGAANTVGTVKVAAGALHIRLAPPPGGNWPDYHVYHHSRLAVEKGHRYRVSFRVRSEPEQSLTVSFYRPGSQFTYLGGPEGPFASQIKLAAKADVNIVSFPVDMPWPEPQKESDFSVADAQCEAVLQANPKALLLPRIGVNPPAWWLRAHPDDAMQWEDGRRGSMVVASPRYRRDAAERLAALVMHLEGKFGDRIAGYHPSGQNTGEWFYDDTWKQPLSGYAPADLVAWRGWLKQRYASDADLRKAWKDRDVRLDAVAVPAASARHAAPAGVLREAASEQALVDFAEFQQQAMADCVCELAKTVRQASGGRKLVVFFYGYVFEFGAAANGPAVSGHYALRRVLNCPDIDVLCAPISYTDRGTGGSAPSMTAAESVALAGKLWLNEDDTHTYLATEKFPGDDVHAATPAETNQLLLRNVAQESLRNFGTWWMDLGASGWFNDPAMWEQMKRIRALDDAMLANPMAFAPEIAAVIDERSMIHVAAGGNVVTHPGIYEARKALGRVGAPYGQYLMDDVLDGKVKAKLYVVLNAWRLSEGQRTKLLAATRGATVVWCYAPGYLADGQDSLRSMRELTGFSMRKVVDTNAWAEPSESGVRLGLRKGWGVGKALTPLFAAADARGEEVLAAYPNGSAAVAMRRGVGGISIFVGAPGLTSELLRVAAKSAGVHLFTEADCNVYANGRYVAFHASQDGELTIDVGQATEVIDLLTNERLGKGPRVTLKTTRGETRVLKY